MSFEATVCPGDIVLYYKTIRVHNGICWDSWSRELVASVAMQLWHSTVYNVFTLIPNKHVNLPLSCALWHVLIIMKKSLQGISVCVCLGSLLTTDKSLVQTILSR